ncbi:MAG: bifunctional proline dehydrogenase/L-glutamate gamma-semialdehyde dehydrogenase PutA [Pseudomonadota bacterium]
MLAKLRKTIRQNTHQSEARAVDYLLDHVEWSSERSKSIQSEAATLVESIRSDNEDHGGLDAFLQEYSLSSQEGIALMCLAESLLRVPDSDTADALIEDKLGSADWESHIGNSDSFFVNASTWGLMLTGKIVALDADTLGNPAGLISRLVARSGDPLIRTAVGQAMKIMGRQFVLAESIQLGIKTARDRESRGFSYSYDMLGEAAKTKADAERYFQAYVNAIDAIGKSCSGTGPEDNPGISVKLSALHPRFEFAQSERVLSELFERLQSLATRAMNLNIGLTIDAEEAARLDLSLSLIEKLVTETPLQNWNGLGIVVQAYQKRAPWVIDWLTRLASENQMRFMVRLVKGAYWDSEIKHAQESGFPDYPVFTRKISTDVSYLLCAQKLLASPQQIYPLFATHNAHTVASIMSFAGSSKAFEFQCLHGMGERLYERIVADHGYRCRIYAPVGPHRDLLAYLVRRLLENGANSSFVNRLVDKNLPVHKIVQDPVALLRTIEPKPHPDIPRPHALYPDRLNSSGLDVDSSPDVDGYQAVAANIYAEDISLEQSLEADIEHDVTNPATGSRIGTVRWAGAADISAAMDSAQHSFPAWDRIGGQGRAEILERAADLYEENRFLLMAIVQREAGKTLADAIAEVREAVDFLRYYALQARKYFEQPVELPGPTGESNQHSYRARGTFVCISPWNFPLAIFTGQVVAALAAGNTVIAKPAEQTSLIALKATELLHDAGVPGDVLHCLPGDGKSVGVPLIAHENVAGVAFTGSTETAKSIQKALADKAGPIVPLIAETGGINAMIVDSTSLPEQVVDDVIRSAFQSAGQRCSALRMLYLQSDIADTVMTMLEGAVEQLSVGDPYLLSTDVGPIIDSAARRIIHTYLEKQQQIWQSDAEVPDTGQYIKPAIVRINSITELEREVFGPVLHVASYDSDNLNDVIDDINRTGYGLTFGLHTRIQQKADHVISRLNAGNLYINRNTIGAIVGVQPFGGYGLSGTGPKAGGPDYIKQFSVEQCVSIDTTAAGGNAALLGLSSL